MLKPVALTFKRNVYFFIDAESLGGKNMPIPGISSEEKFSELAVAIRAEISVGYQMQPGIKATDDGYRRAAYLHRVIANIAEPDDFTPLLERGRTLMAAVEALLLSSSERLKGRVCEVIANKYVELELVNKEKTEIALQKPVAFTTWIIQEYKKHLSDTELADYNEKLKDYRDGSMVNPNLEKAKASVASGLSRVGSFFSSLARRNSGAPPAASLAATASSDAVDAAGTAMRPGTPGSA